uniref:GRIP domain-containing protein n=1 Tax=Rhizochromulina marina TaxID=1034831 RepID=A0A7S2WTQ4_9STRA|mmetsp:Transcript_33350/g.96657  ORF Transcript_33350/g.96657 Transcript_33350/m.96657 type:complete len:705 (+) Transcript_33350:81-2195(+)
MANLIGAVRRLGSELAEIVAPLDEYDEDDAYSSAGGGEAGFIDGLAPGTPRMDAPTQEQQSDFATANMVQELEHKTAEVEALQGELRSLKELLRQEVEHRDDAVAAAAAASSPTASMSSSWADCETLTGLLSESDLAASNGDVVSCIKGIIAERTAVREEARAANVMVQGLRHTLRSTVGVSEATGDGGNALAHSTMDSAKTLDARGCPASNLLGDLADLQAELVEVLRPLETVRELSGAAPSSGFTGISQRGKSMPVVEDKLGASARHSEDGSALAPPHDQVGGAAYEQRIKDLQEQVLELTSQWSSAKEAAAAAAHESQQLRQIITQLRSNSTSRAKEVESSATERRKLLDSLAEAERENASLRASLERHALQRAQEFEAGEDYVRLQSTVRQLQSELEVQVEAHQQEASELGHAVADTQQKLALAQKASRDAETRARALEADLELTRQDHERSSLISANLQRVLEQFQSDKGAELAQLRELHEREVTGLQEALSSQVAQLRKAHTEELDQRSEETNRARMAMDHAQHQLALVEKDKERKIADMRRSLDQAIAQLQASDEDVVDRKLITNLIVAYHSRARSREVLELMSRILNFSVEDQRKVGLLGRGLGIGKLLGNVLTPLPTPELPRDQVENSSLLELWVAFLEAEAPSPHSTGGSEYAHPEESAPGTVPPLTATNRSSISTQLPAAESQRTQDIPGGSS